MAPLGLVLAPELRWRRWRWEVREHEIDIRHGTFAIHAHARADAARPARRHERDLIQQMLGLSTVVFHTAAGSNEIPALDDYTAGLVRDRIAELARTADEL